MNAFLKHLWVQFKMDIRERGTLMTYYLIPLVFYFVMGAVFSSINPLSRQTLAATMVIFAVTMGAVLGIPVPIVKMRESGVLRAYRVCGIPGWAVLCIQSVSAFLHLLVVSIIIFVTAPLFFGASYPQSFPAYFLSLFIFTICKYYARFVYRCGGAEPAHCDNAFSGDISTYDDARRNNVPRIHAP